MTTNQFDPRLLDILACPRDHGALTWDGQRLHCAHGHSYPVVEGIPVLLMPEKPLTMGLLRASYEAAETGAGAPLYLDTVGISDEQREGVRRLWDARTPQSADAVISYLVAATSGMAYIDMLGKLTEYPIPNIPIPIGKGLLLDVGCNWGRWSVSAARKGWSVVGLDPSLGALLASKRAFGASDPSILRICGDARFMPLKPGVFDYIFSYGVLQHFSEADAELALVESARTAKDGSPTKFQMAHSGGFRSRYWLARRTDPEAEGPFRVRFWTYSQLARVFDSVIGPSRLLAEGYGGLGLLWEDAKYTSPFFKTVIAGSTVLKHMSRAVPLLDRVADSIYVESTKRPQARGQAA